MPNKATLTLLKVRLRRTGATAAPAVAAAVTPAASAPGISQAKHERLCAQPLEIPSDAMVILLIDPTIMPLQIFFFAQDLTVKQAYGRPEINQCSPI